MNRIDQLIAEMCPDGVEIRELGSIVNILDSQRRPVSKENRKQGSYPYYGANGIVDYIDSFLFDGVYLLVGEDGSVITNEGTPVVNWATGKIWVNNHAHVLREMPEVASLRYVYFQLQTIDVTDLVRGTPPKLNQASLRGISIPLPPLPIQHEIVKILDTFSELEAELEAELDARKKQYEYYRDELLTFGEDEVEWKTLGEVCTNVSSGGTPLSTRTDYYDGTIPWLRTQEVRYTDIYQTEIRITEKGLTNSSAKWIPANCVIIAISGATAGRAAINKIALTTNQHCCNLEIDDAIAEYRYVFHWVSKQYTRLKSLGQGARNDLNAGLIRSFPIPLPSVDVQRSIVNTLDKFDALVNDLSSGLPAEIAARRKQYEHYRDRLLTFKEKVA